MKPSNAEEINEWLHRQNMSKTFVVEGTKDDFFGSNYILKENFQNQFNKIMETPDLERILQKLIVGKHVRKDW